MQQSEADREAHLRKLAAELLFTMESQGPRFRLHRDAEVSKPVQYEELTLDEVQEVLDTWKLRGGG